MSETLLIAPATDADGDGLVSLWESCGLTRPWNDPRADIAFARSSPNAAVLTGRLGGAVKASAMVGHDGHRGWVYYLAVDPSLRGRGFGRKMMRAAEAWLIERGVPKLMLMVRADNKAVCNFYEAVGYQRQERVIFARWLDGRPMTP
ncbi:MAG TPA: GNAT family acetyltransferase [Pseudorhodoplanes sp.]|jgi:ribosomal protein S18 acetylase RimI-like enzyme|nr:GNAT family acetyltransferase [Pseudorhodoplanes sp.]